LTERRCLLCGKPMGPGHSFSCSGSKAKADASVGTAGPAESQIQAQIIMAQDLLEDARSLGIDVSEFERRLFNLEKERAENLVASVAPLMSDLSQAIEGFRNAEEVDAASMASKVEGQLTILRSLVEEARSVGADASRFETELSGLEKSLDESRVETTRLRWISSSANMLTGELSGILESLQRELEREPTSLEAEIYEYLMKHGGMSVSTYSKECGLTEEETRKAIDRLVELDMIEVRKV